jgi:hypothetical protein
MQNRKILIQRDLKTLKGISSGDMLKMAESLSAQEIARYAPRPAAEFRLNTISIN